MIGEKREVVLRFLATPIDVNFGGNVHGGTVMKWIDQAGYTCAAAWSGKYCVTVYVGGIQFYRPIRVSQLVEIQAKILYTGKKSMHIGVSVFAGDPKINDPHLTSDCIIIFVAMDEDGNTDFVEPWKPITEEDKALEAHAIRMMELRKAIEGKKL